MNNLVANDNLMQKCDSISDDSMQNLNSVLNDNSIQKLAQNMLHTSIDRNLFELWSKSLNIDAENAGEYINIVKSFLNWLQKRPIKVDNELFENWVAYLDVEPESVKTYTKSVKLFINWLQDNNIVQPTKADIIAYKKELESSLKPTTVQTYIVSIKQFFKWLEEEGLYKNIADNIKCDSVGKEFKKDYLTPEQVRKVLSGIKQDTLKGIRDYAMISLMVTSGLRTIEIHRANIGDISFIGENVILYVRRKGKKDKTQYVKLASEVHEAIKKYLLLRFKDAEYQNTEPLFASTSNNSYGNRMTTTRISSAVKNCFTWVGLDSSRLTAHSLRHTAATLNIKEGQKAGVINTLEQTRQMLGHSKLEITTIYDHHLKRESNMSEQRVADAIFS